MTDRCVQDSGTRHEEVEGVWIDILECPTLLGKRNVHLLGARMDVVYQKGEFTHGALSRIDRLRRARRRLYFIQCPLQFLEEETVRSCGSIRDDKVVIVPESLALGG